MINWHKYPFIRLLIPFVFGVIFFSQKQFLEIYSLVSIVAICIAVLFILNRGFLTIKTNFLFGILLNLTLFFSGFAVASLNVVLDNGANLIEAQYAKCTIVEPVKEKTNSYQLVVTVTGIQMDSNWVVTNGKTIVYLEKDSSSSLIRMGDKLLIASDFNLITPPKNPNEFNYKNYLSNRGITHQTYVRSKDFLLLNEKSENIYTYSNEARNYLLATLEKSGVVDDQFAIASALILGDKDNLDYDVKKSYAAAGAMHVLAVSGLHVGIVFLLLNSLLFFMNKNQKSRVLKATLLILCLWIYALLTGLSPSVLRASTMFSFVIVGTALNRKSSIYNTLGASAFFLLIINPNLLFEVGFQLSYVAVLGIVYLQPLIYKRIYTRWWLLDKIWAITAVSIAAQIATLPLTLYYFQQFPTYFMISNLLVIPAAMVVLCLGILLLITSPIPIISESIGWVLNNFIQGLNWGVKGIEELPNSLVEGVSITILECCVLYLIILLVIIGLQQRKVKFINVSLMLSILFISNDLWEDFNLANSKSVVVYHINKNQAIDFIDGNENTLLTKESLIEDKQKIDFHIKSHWATKDLNNTQFVASNLGALDTLLMDSKLEFVDSYSQFYNQRMVRVGADFKVKYLENKLSIDYVLLSDNSKVKLKDLYSMYNFRTVIVDGSNSIWNRNRVEEEGFQLHIPIINTDNGAFVAKM